MSEFQPLPGVQESWDNRSPSELEKYGQGTEGVARLAAGFGGEQIQGLARNMTGAVKSFLPGDVHGGNLDEDYADVSSDSFRAPEFDIDLNGLDKIENRMKLLDGLT
jgi:hypothetical protein